MDLPLHRAGEHRRTASSLAGAAFSVAAEKYKAHKLAAGKWRPSTAEVFDHEMKQALGILYDRPVSEITTDDVELLWFTLAGRALSKQWIERVRVDLQSLFRWLLRHGAISSDPMQIWERTEIGEDEHLRIFHDFTRAEIEKLTAKARPTIAKFVWTACYTGLRRGNIAAMRWWWIDEAWVCEIPGREFKQKRRHRIPIHHDLQVILAPRGEPEERVISGLCHVTRINTVLKELAKKTEITPAWVYPHNFRRTFCSWLHAAGVTRQEAMDLLGSKSESVLLRHYWPETEDREKWSIISKLKNSPTPSAPSAFFQP